ncbi:MAG: hypothetical protein EOO39_46440, partial [Cytophagaceae bacterium]
AAEAVAVTRERCWKYDWCVEFDIRRAFDELDWDLMRRAISKHVKDPWARLYIERWLTAPAVSPDGQPVRRTKGVPQGSVIGPSASPDSVSTPTPCAFRTVVAAGTVAMGWEANFFFTAGRCPVVEAFALASTFLAGAGCCATQAHNSHKHTLASRPMYFDFIRLFVINKFLRVSRFQSIITRLPYTILMAIRWQALLM